MESGSVYLLICCRLRPSGHFVSRERNTCREFPLSRMIDFYYCAIDSVLALPLANYDAALRRDQVMHPVL